MTAKAEGISVQNPQVAPQFALIETSREARRRRRASFGVGTLTQGLVLMILVWVLTTAPSWRDREGPNMFWAERITLLAPPPASLPQSRKVTPSSSPPRPLKKTAELPKVEPRPIVPAVASALTKPQPSPLPSPPRLTAVPPRTRMFETAVPKWQPQTRVGAFGNSSAVATLSLPRSKVQTGGFGSPDGLPGQAKGGSLGNVAHLGSFDRPEGAGSGNGTGGERGARGLVATAGFGNGIAEAGPGRSGAGMGNGVVHSAGFADAQVQASASPKPQAGPVPYEPVQIAEKPDPVYTAEARQLRIQGEVLLRVVFTVSGRVQVLGVERGLGHGLDEAAIRAAGQIQFRPARRNGQPVDTAATLHILFQLAN